MKPRHRQFQSLGPHGFHRIDYAEWSLPESGGATTICIHGLTRNGSDFDPLAAALCHRGPVLVPDMPGRGRSEWLNHPEDYAYPVYLQDVAQLIARSGAETVDFIGTSMGGIIGMMLASMAGTPIRRLVVNDVGPFIPKEALAQIGAHVGRDPHFADLGAFERHLRLIHAPFGALTDEQWRHMAERGHRRPEGGGFASAYDPTIGEVFKGALEDVSFWELYDRIVCPVLVIRGARSTLLLPQTAEEMTMRGPLASLYVVADAGHAPALMAPEQIARIERFLAAADPRSDG